MTDYSPDQVRCEVGALPLRSVPPNYRPTEIMEALTVLARLDAPLGDHHPMAPKPVTRTGVTLAAVAAVVAIACGSGDNGPSTAPKGGDDKPAASEAVKASTVKVGATLVLTDKMLGEESSAEITVAAPKTATKDKSGFGKPEKGQYLVLTVTAVSKTGKYHANPFSFKLVGADNTVYETAFAEFPPQLNAADLAAGQKTSGNIVFDIPKGALTGMKVALKDPLGESDLGYWTL